MIPPALEEEISEVEQWIGGMPGQKAGVPRLRGLRLAVIQALNTRASTNMHKHTELLNRAIRLLELVEWVRSSGGKAFSCPFCGGVSERSNGPGHSIDCEGEMVKREGNQLLSDAGMLL
jgi:hypothetical protein